MVRKHAAWVVVLALVSCGTARFPTRSAETWYESLDGEREDALTAFETVERLKDDPLDPRRASVEELLTIPGFPEPLAGSVLRAVRRRRPGRSWVEDLTPPERAQLYRYREFILLPERPRTSLRGRVTDVGAGEGGIRRRDWRLNLSGDDCTVLVRSRDLDIAHKSAFYASVPAASGALRLHAGAFVSDLAMGLIFGGGFRAYALSDAYRLGASRWITGSTSFYERVLWGGAVEMWHRSVRAVLLSGNLRSFASDRFELDRHRVSGWRIGLRRGALEAGLGAIHGEAVSDGSRYSIDGRYRDGRLGVAFEIAYGGSGDPSSVCSFSYRSERARSALVLHAIPSGASGPSSKIDTRRLAPTSSYLGITAAGEVEIMAGIRTRASLEHYARSDGFEDDGKNVFRAECERTGKRVRLRVSWSSRMEHAYRLIPIPAEPDDDIDHAGVLGGLCAARLARWTTGKISGRYALGNGSRGVLVSPSLSLVLFSGRVESDVTYTTFRTLEGTEKHYFYEPSLEGTYPWVTASGTGNRASFLITFRTNWLSLSSKVILEAGKSLEAQFQGALWTR
jgi:hypothetical protein